MKKLIFLMTLFLCLSFAEVNAQIEIPSPSPTVKVEQEVGLITVELDYSRPGVKGRELFVDVEKFGKIWRTGANASTKITFSGDVKINGNDLKAGTYAIYSIPARIGEDWTIMFYNDLTLGGRIDDYDQAKEALRITSKAQELPIEVETFTIHVGNLKPDGAELALVWGNYYVPLQLTVDTDSKVMASIDEAMKGPSADEYYSAAYYYYSSGKDMTKALDWVRKANAEAPRYWRKRLEAQILAKLEKYEEAKKALKGSSDMAREAGNNGYAEANMKIAESWPSK